MIATAMQPASLYERLGTIDCIKDLVDDILEAHMNNPVINARFLSYKNQPEKMKHTKELLVQFLCAGSGGSQLYTGRDMLATHRGMNISAAEYMAVLDDILNVLEKHHIDQETQKDILFIGYSLKNQIIGV
jgi:hemoglobin